MALDYKQAKENLTAHVAKITEQRDELLEALRGALLHTETLIIAAEKGEIKISPNALNHAKTDYALGISAIAKAEQ